MVMVQEQCTVTIDGDSKIDSKFPSLLKDLDILLELLTLKSAGIPVGTTRPTFDVIITPQGGHGADIYRELGAYSV